MNNSKAIGIFGGTFDPIHFGHLRTALELYEQLPVQEIRFLPCQQPVHKPASYASSEQRVAMLELAIANQPGFTIDKRELERPTPSYMHETLSSIRQEVGNTPLCLICSLDAFANFTTWYRWQAIFELAHVVVANRGDYTPPQLNDFFSSRLNQASQNLLEKPAGYLYFAKTTTLAISSTYIRQRLQAGFSVRYLLPDSVLNYLNKSNLYTQTN